MCSTSSLVLHYIYNYMYMYKDLALSLKSDHRLRGCNLVHYAYYKTTLPTPLLVVRVCSVYQLQSKQNGSIMYDLLKLLLVGHALYADSSQ